MTKGELAVLIKKVQAECGLEEPTKVTYYRNEEGKVVFKLWFDSLILPKSLSGEDVDEFEWKANVNNTFINNEPYLYEDDFEIIEYNEEKGWVKVIPDNQDFEVVESYNKLINLKDDAIKLQGKRLSEKVAKAYNLTLYEAENAEDITVEGDVAKKAKEAKKEETNKVQEKNPAIFFAFNLTCAGLVAEELKKFANLIKEANDVASKSEKPATVKLIFFPSEDYTAISFYDMMTMADIFTQQGIPTKSSNFAENHMKGIIDALTDEATIDRANSAVIASSNASNIISKSYPTLAKMLKSDTIPGYDNINLSAIREAMIQLENESAKRLTSVLDPIAKQIAEDYCTAANEGKIRDAKEAAGGSEEAEEEEKKEDPEPPKKNESRRMLKSILAGRLLEDGEEAEATAEGEAGQSESTEEQSTEEASTENTEDKKEEKKEEKGDKSFNEAWKKAVEKYGDGSSLPNSAKAVIVYLDSYCAKAGGDINKYYSQSEAKQALADKNAAAAAAYDQIKDMKIDTKSSIQTALKYGPLVAAEAALVKNSMGKDDFNKGATSGESSGFSIEIKKGAAKIDDKKPEADKGGELKPIDFHIFSVMDYEPPKGNSDKLSMYWTAEKVER